MSLSIADTVTAIPFSTIMNASDSLAVSTVTEDSLLVTKHYVDKQIQTINDRQSFVNSSLSVIEQKISEMDNFAAVFDVTIPTTIKPDIASDRATIATITTSKKDPTHIRVDLSDFARKRNPLFYGTPKIDVSPNISTAADKDIVTAGFVRNMFASATSTAQPYSSALTSIASLNLNKDQILYTTASNTYSSASCTSLGRDILSKDRAEAVRTALDLPQPDKRNVWQCTVATAITAQTADFATKAQYDKNDRDISTHYLKKGDVTISDTLSEGTIIASYNTGEDNGKIRVDLSGFASLAGPSFSGKPTAPTADKNDNSKQIATTEFVHNAIAEITGTGNDNTNLTLGNLFKAIGNNLNFSHDVYESLSATQSATQPLDSALTSIADLTVPKDHMLYTSGLNQYYFTPVTKFARDNILNSSDVTELRSVLFGTSGSVGSSSSVINVTVTNSLSALISNTALSAIISNSAIYDDSGNKISTDYVKIEDLHQLKAAGHLNWKSAAAGKSKALSMNSLAYWNGKYNDSRSNLAYCNRGAFGDIVTHSTTDFVSQSSMAATLNAYNSSLSKSYLTSTQISNIYLSMSSASSMFLSKTDQAFSASMAKEAYKLAQPVNLSIADGYNLTSVGTAVSFDGSSSVTLRLPTTIRVNLAKESTAYTQKTTDNSSNIATTAFVHNAIAGITTSDTTPGALVATKLSTARNIEGISFDGTANIVRYGRCSTPGDDQIKNVDIPNFDLVTGARITVKFDNTNTKANPKLQISKQSLTTKPIMYRGKNVPVNAIRSNGTYDFVYDGTNWDIVGSLIWTED